MIEKNEIIKCAKANNLDLSIIEKDYVLGWILAAIQNQKNISENWIFKGGTCLKKCYFDNYRFSEDLDFSLIDPSQVNEKFLKDSFLFMTNWLYDEIGLEIPIKGIEIYLYKNKQNNTSAQVSLKYCGPLHPKTKSSWPKVKFDLTADEKIVMLPEKRKIFHHYSDEPIEGIYVNAYPIEEIFAEKLRALVERGRPRDLYDVIMLFHEKDYFKLSSVNCSGILKKKCLHKSINLPNISIMENHPQKEILNSQWQNMLQHQISNLPSWDIFWKKLPGVFKWLKISSDE
jgi:predicted nucleotidyltransferase component of viral defense system